MKIELYQTWHDEHSYPEDSTGLLPFDCRKNPEFHKRESAHLIRLYDEVIQKSDIESYFGLLSPKFSDKSKISIEQIRRHITENPGYDIYLFNPFPLLTYQNLNVWTHGESKHSGIIDLTQHLFNKAEFPINIKERHRNNLENTVYCNYWVASKNFFDDYIKVIKKLDLTIENMPHSDKNKYFSETTYCTTACFYPFIFERIICSFLLLNKNYNVKPYIYNHHSHIFNGSKKVNRKFYERELHIHFDSWEKNIADLDKIEYGINFVQNTLNPQLPKSSIKFIDKVVESTYKRIRISHLKTKLMKINHNS